MESSSTRCLLPGALLPPALSKWGRGWQCYRLFRCWKNSRYGDQVQNDQVGPRQWSVAADQWCRWPLMFFCPMLVVCFSVCLSFSIFISRFVSGCRCTLRVFEDSGFQNCGVSPFVGTTSTPSKMIHGKTPHIWLDCPYMGSLPIIGKSDLLWEDFPWSPLNEAS